MDSWRRSQKRQDTPHTCAPISIEPPAGISTFSRGHISPNPFFASVLIVGANKRDYMDSGAIQSLEKQSITHDSERSFLLSIPCHIKVTMEVELSGCDVNDARGVSFGSERRDSYFSTLSVAASSTSTCSSEASLECAREDAVKRKPAPAFLLDLPSIRLM